ncbi:thiamine diphosphokinase [Candidatus Poribacteria bacterium]|nr:thiamine diphosphokinase [Candidatus Poribacteria bacterium]
MKTALIFLNGFYDYSHLTFYRKEIEKGIENDRYLICADGGLQLFDKLNEIDKINMKPDILIGDLDSVDNTRTQAKQVVEQWVGQTDKDYTDGQLAVKYALEEYNCKRIIIYGGLPKPDGYETDHFLGNLKLMPFGYYNVGFTKQYKAEMRDPQQTIYYLTSQLRIERQNKNLQRVSIIANESKAIVESSTNLRWSLSSFHIHPYNTNALRNEFLNDADWVDIKLADNSAPVYVIHNW